MTTRTVVSTIGVAIVAIAFSAVIGCSTTTESLTAVPKSTGFLSTYRFLEPSSPASLDYVDPNNRLARYTKFIVMPIEFRTYKRSDVSEEERQTIKSYLRDSLVTALAERYEIVATPSWDAAEIRIAVTDIQKSTPVLNVIPRPKLWEIGLGGLSMEGEIIDSVSNVQIAALVESRTGHNRSFDFTQLDDTKAVMDEWAWHLTSLVDEAHGYAVAREEMTWAYTE